MKIPQNAIIVPEKLTEYLLVPQTKNDKAQFLAQAGFAADNPATLEQAIRTLIAGNEAVQDRQDVYGTFYQVTGELVGPNGIISVVTVWILRTIDGQYRFVTLKPARRNR
ncbi:hypothetical protein BH10CHL1_BH10CHL1_36980 [soil metagenome]